MRAALADLLTGRVGRYVYVSSQSLYQMTGTFPWREDSPLWARTFDFAYEAEVAALARAR